MASDHIRSSASQDQVQKQTDVSGAVGGKNASPCRVVVSHVRLPAHDSNVQSCLGTPNQEPESVSESAALMIRRLLSRRLVQIWLAWSQNLVNLLINQVKCWFSKDLVGVHFFATTNYNCIVQARSCRY